MLENTPLCQMLGIRYAILQGGMAWLGTSELVAAVSEAGGLGIIGSGNARPEWLREQINATRQLTNKPFGVNIMLMSHFTEENLKVVASENVKIVTFGGGNPGPLIPNLKKNNITIIPVVSSVALARRLEKAGADAIIAEGTEAGGHVGDTTTMALVPQVVNSIKIPVIAAGGIADGRGLIAALALGAQGVQMGTRFICSDECIAHPSFKQHIIESHDRATTISGRTTGHPARSLENRFTREFTQKEKECCPAEELYEISKNKLRAGVLEGDIVNGSLMAGQISGSIKEILPVRDIINNTIVQAEEIIRDFCKLARENNING
jgi:enoyl-[acyl-carrier protein] reductase II